MPISEHVLLRNFGAAALAGNAALFVGAGLSRAAGHVDWNGLLKSPRATAKIPLSLTDLPLVAQYYVQSVPGGREALEQHILQEMASTQARPTQGHAEIAKIPFSEIWTTNYDWLIEESVPGVRVITKDEDLLQRSVGGIRVTKMHGSLLNGTPVRWASPPVITRKDFEQYEFTHPRIWSSLTATYLTRSILFLGFSFADPNVEVLLRLARTRVNLGGPEHFTVLKRPTSRNELALHDHQVGDLEQSGVAVVEIDDFADLDPLLKRLAQRTRDPWLFVSGSNTAELSEHKHDELLGYELVESNVEVVSLAGATSMNVSFALGRTLKAEGGYDPSRMRFFFRKRDAAVPELPQRMGTATFTDFPVEQLREFTISKCRAMVILGGGERTKLEVDCAQRHQVPIIPIAATGGAAREIWETLSQDLAYTGNTNSLFDGQDWSLLADSDPRVAVRAASRMALHSMFLGPLSDPTDKVNT
ncbi:SIR2 family protein [Streptomyces sp. NPDC058463]|uniref:SIR2 family protein n=1 Tax=Streptomyces sp. NPDC058463 TaxID=3346510 RepID=UPI0036694A3B